MAVLVRTRRLSNPGKKRMSLKQKLHFGTARQRAAARLSLKGKRKNPSYHSSMKSQTEQGRRSYKLYEQTSQLRRAKGSKRRRKNIGEIVSISLAGLAGNPGKKSSTRFNDYNWHGTQ